MSYEQKYLKYKQKYQELKRQLMAGNSVQTGGGDEEEFILTDTPTGTIMNQRGGNSVEPEYLLTETPTFEDQRGGNLTLAPADFAPAPLTSCPGQVNPLPDSSMGLSTMLADLAANPAGPVMPAPVQTAGGDEELQQTTTEISDLQNTEDIERLFAQFGGKRGRPRSAKNSETLTHSQTSTRSGRSARSGRSKSSSEDSEDSSSSSSIISDFDDSISVSDL